MLSFKVKKENSHLESFKAVGNDNKYKRKSIYCMQELNMMHKEHTRKQVQMHTVACSIAQRFEKKHPERIWLYV